MSPLNQRRLENFHKNKRAYYSLWVFSMLFIVSMFTEFIANDKPIVFGYKGEIYLPLIFTYSDKQLGGVLETEAWYIDPYTEREIEEHGWAIWPPIRYSFDTLDWDRTIVPAGPDSEHWLGTDGFGTDIVAKLLYGFRLSVLFGIILTILASTIGICVGAVQGYFGGLVDLIGQRIVEVWIGLPVLFVLIILASMVEPNVYWLLGILVMFSWMTLVGVVRAEFLRARNFEFVRAAWGLGVRDFVVIFRHVLPNAAVSALTYLPFILTSSIVSLTALDFLGFGLPIESPSLGRLLSAAKSNLQAWWIGAGVFTTLVVMLTLLIFIGEGVRDALDPRRSIGTRGEGLTIQTPLEARAQ
ncbi:MAG: ABC transporter permease [Gammaproteobacteria bacterium]|nr:ABC transporter permease [Gammaproteobacteria bacterium]